MFICWNVCYWTGFFPVSIRVASQQLDPVLPSSFYFLLFFFSFYRVSCDVCDRNLFGSGLCTRIQCVTGFYLVEYWVFFFVVSLRNRLGYRWRHPTEFGCILLIFSINYFCYWRLNFKCRSSNQPSSADVLPSFFFFNFIWFSGGWTSFV